VSYLLPLPVWRWLRSVVSSCQASLSTHSTPHPTHRHTDYYTLALHTQLKTQSLPSDHKAASNREMENCYLRQARKKSLHLEEVINLLTTDVKLSQIPLHSTRSETCHVHSGIWHLLGEMWHLTSNFIWGSIQLPSATRRDLCGSKCTTIYCSWDFATERSHCGSLKLVFKWTLCRRWASEQRNQYIGWNDSLNHGLLHNKPKYMISWRVRSYAMLSGDPTV